MNYKFSLKKETEINSFNIYETMGQGSTEEKAVIYDEILSYSYDCGKDRIRMSPIVNTCSKEVFIPKTKYSLLTGDEDATDLLVAKKMALSMSKSFVFSKELLNIIGKNCKEEYHTFLFDSLINFGNFELFVINTKNIGLTV